MKGTGEQLFNFIVNSLQKFLKEFSLEEVCRLSCSNVAVFELEQA